MWPIHLHLGCSLLHQNFEFFNKFNILTELIDNFVLNRWLQEALALGTSFSMDSIFSGKNDVAVRGLTRSNEPLHCY
jgi:hypothetical protein